jgi:LmbE family N-acetylglucosaminyl deacetylase
MIHKAAGSALTFVDDYPDRRHEGVRPPAVPWLSLQVTPRRRAPAPLRGDIAILSPHLDDAVYSLGAAIGESVRAGAHISVITVFAGDPDSRRPPSPWDRRFGFRSAGEAARARRAEDRRACELLGASPVWLPFDDEHGEPAGADELWESIQDAVGHVDAVLVPGFPLSHKDHLRLARVVLARRFETADLGLYAEQPYAAVVDKRPGVPTTLTTLMQREPDWRVLNVGVVARWRKVRAWRAYRSQFQYFGYRSLANVMRYEARHGGELTTLR